MPLRDGIFSVPILRTHMATMHSSRSDAIPSISTSLVTDEELLFRFVHDGDSAAFRELVEAHYSLVNGVCRQVLQHEADAEDACQATFIVLAKQGHKVRDANSLAGWLYRVAYRVASRLRKSRQKMQSVDFKDLQDSVDDELARICNRENILVLHEELSRLPRKYRDPLVLHYLEFHTRGEIASQLDTTDASIKARLARARRNVSTCLRHLLVEISVVWTRFASSLSWMWGPAPTPPGFS